MSSVLALKLTLVPAFIAAITLAGRRWGPAVAGWLSAFPVVSAPILFFIAIEQGATFAATAAVGTLSAVPAILAFGISYAWAALRYSWRISLIAGFAAYALAVTSLSFCRPSLSMAIPAVMAALLIAPRLYPSSARRIPQASMPPRDLAWRMLAGALLVLLVTHYSARLGPQLSGVFAMFPVMASVLVVFSHRHAGAAFAIQLLRGMVLGYYGFAGFCLVLALALPVMSLGPGFLAALACALMLQFISRFFLQRAQRASQTDALRTVEPGA